MHLVTNISYSVSSDWIQTGRSCLAYSSSSSSLRRKSDLMLAILNHFHQIPVMHYSNCVTVSYPFRKNSLLDAANGIAQENRRCR